jgi:hypothetical protein
MILVLRAISDTDVNLPVPRRMSKGLRTVGAEMTMLLVVEELLALGLLWWVEITVSLYLLRRVHSCGVFSDAGFDRSCENGSASARSSSSSTTFSSSHFSRRSFRSTSNVSRCVDRLIEAEGANSVLTLHLYDYGAPRAARRSARPEQRRPVQASDGNCRRFRPPARNRARSLTS